MREVEQDVMCVLLQTLLDKKLITKDVHNKSQDMVLGTLDWPEFFCYAEDDGKEDTDGST